MFGEDVEVIISSSLCILCYQWKFVVIFFESIIFMFFSSHVEFFEICCNFLKANNFIYLLWLLFMFMFWNILFGKLCKLLFWQMKLHIICSMFEYWWWLTIFQTIVQEEDTQPLTGIMCSIFFNGLRVKPPFMIIDEIFYRL